MLLSGSGGRHCPGRSGLVSPSGKLPVTFYASDADLPEFTDYAMANRTYRYFSGRAQYPFGYGLSYTRFTCDGLHAAGRGGRWSVTVTNTGERDGEEVVQWYLEGDDPEYPRRQLLGVQRLRLRPGQSRTVHFRLAPDTRRRWMGDQPVRLRVAELTASLEALIPIRNGINPAIA